MPDAKPEFVPTAVQFRAKELFRTHKFVLLAGGSRSGKTAFSVYTLIQRAQICKCRQAILRFHFNDVKRSIGMDTMPKILKMMHVPYDLNKSDWVFTFSNGSEIWLGGLDDKQRVEKVLGNEYSTIYINEASQISYHAYTTALTRLAENAGLNNRILIDCNPPEKSHWLYRMFVELKQPDTNAPLPRPELYGMMTMNPADNPHLSEDYIRDVLSTLPDRQKKRFLYGEWLDKRSGALFSAEQIERARVSVPPEYLQHTVVAVDVAVSSGEDSDETGIVTVGLGEDGSYYVLRDDSLKGTPAEWSYAVSAAYSSQPFADGAVYETNQGGEMIAHTIHSVNPSLPCFPVRATHGKAVRAEPVAALYEQGLVHHVGFFPELEEQMTEWVPGDPKSPDRLDALVWAVTYLQKFRKQSGGQIMDMPVLASSPHIPYSRGCRSGVPVFFNGGRR